MFLKMYFLRLHLLFFSDNLSDMNEWHGKKKDKEPDS